MFEIVDRDYFGVAVLANGEVLTSDKDSTSSRQVFIFDTFVVKFDGGSSWQNEREIHFYENVLEEEDAHFFPKLLGYGVHNGEKFLIQERVEHTEPITQQHADDFDILRARYGIDDVIVLSPDDSPYRRNGYICNAAITKDGLKIFDIGINQNDWCDNDSSSSPYSSSPSCDCSDCRY